MNIIIPLGGKGERFKNKGYKQPKPLIPIFNKPMIFYVLDNLQLTPEDNVYIFYYNLTGFGSFDTEIHKKYPNVHLFRLQKQTIGAAETIMLGLESVMNTLDNLHKKTILLDCDTFYTQDVLSMYRNINENAVFYVKDTTPNPIFSYIKLSKQTFRDCSDNTGKYRKGLWISENCKTELLNYMSENGTSVSLDRQKSIEEYDLDVIIAIKEKQKISDNANTGIYCFNNTTELYEYSKKVVDTGRMFNNECYTSCIIDAMLDDKKRFIGIELEKSNVFNLGTPEQLQEYIDNTYLYLFDLDGTLVITEHIYYDIWKEILIDYNIELTKEIFNTYISGNSDTLALTKLIPNKYHNLIESISKKKDELFSKHIDQVKIIDGSYEFLSKVYQAGHKMAIVTNCNRGAVEEILEVLKINHFFEFVIIGNECANPKPFPDPYNRGVELFCGKSNKAIIFEDSKTGLLSAKGANPHCIVGIETNYTGPELINYFADTTIKNFIDVDISSFIKFEKKLNNDTIIKQIKEVLNNNVISIEIYDNKLKGGFISDVIDLSIQMNNYAMLDCVLKLENKQENFLTQMSNTLDLYNREYYFYETISKHVPLKIPKFYGTLKDDDFNNTGILMENLISRGFKLNLNLNKEPMKVSLNIIDSIASMHAKFWDKPIQKKFKELKKNNHEMFNPVWDNFISERWDLFKTRWHNILNKQQLELGDAIVEKFSRIQEDLSESPLTLVHGDVKSANIFYKPTEDENYEPYFIDWQYIVLGKGVQDLVFFMIESFEMDKMNIYKPLLKEYYYVKLLELGVKNYSRVQYEKDFLNASYYFPFFVACWFGTINPDELIDKNFPFFFIQRLFHFYII